MLQITLTVCVHSAHNPHGPCTPRTESIHSDTVTSFEKQSLPWYWPESSKSKERNEGIRIRIRRRREVRGRWRRSEVLSVGMGSSPICAYRCIFYCGSIRAMYFALYTSRVRYLSFVSWVSNIDLNVKMFLRRVYLQHIRFIQTKMRKCFDEYACSVFILHKWSSIYRFHQVQFTLYIAM